jgi:hypothetical protein
MRKFCTILALVAILGLGFAPMAFAGHNDGCPPYNPNCNQDEGGGDGGGGNTIGDIDARGGDGGSVFGSGNSSSLAGGGDAGVYGSGNSDNTNRNLNDSTFGNSAAGAAILGSGNSGSSSSIGDVGNGILRGSEFGNSSSDSAASAEQGQQQGQMQGLVGIQGQLGILDNEVDVSNVLDNGNEISTMTGTSTYNSSSTDTATSTDQNQTSVGEVDVDSHDSVVVEGDETVYEAARFPVNTAAPVFAGNCAQGVSAQWMSGGGSIASGNPVCDYIAVSGAYIAGGDRDEAFRVLRKAEKAADWRFFFSRVRMAMTLGIL